MPSTHRTSEPSLWSLIVPKLGEIKFKSTRHGRLGIKTTMKPKPVKQKTYMCPTCRKELVDTIRGKFCPIDKKYFLESEAIISVRDKETGKEYSWADFKGMFPKTKLAKAVALVDSHKIDYGITDSTSSYFVVPLNEYENILKYNQLCCLLRDNNLTLITSPITLVEGSETIHIFAIFADLTRGGLIAVQLLKKEGMREVPADASFTERVENPTQVATIRKGLYKDKFQF